MSGDISGELNPWRRLRALKGWTLLWHDGGDLGCTDHDARTISLRRGQTRVERWCTLLHECLHAERGPALDVLADREELRVSRLTARLLLPGIRPVGEALAWSQLKVREAAVELGVDAGVLWDRLDCLHPAEEHYLRSRLRDL